MMIAVFQKELRQYFHSLAGYLFLSAFFVLSGYLFYSTNLLPLSADSKPFFMNFLQVLLFLAPMLTMRLFAEERKGKTEQLLFTLPLSVWDLVKGKYLAAFVVFLMGMSVILLYMLTLFLHGATDVFSMLGNYLGVMAVMSAFLAIGCFLSALTESQMVAGILSYVVLLGFWYTDYVIDYFSMSGYNMQIFQWLSIRNRFEPFSLGIFDFFALIYFFSIAGIFLLMTVRLLERREYR